MIKKLFWLAIIIGAIYYFFLYQPLVPDNFTGQNNFSSANSNIINLENQTYEISETDNGIIIAFSANIPKEVFDKALSIGKKISTEKQKDVKVIGFMNFGNNTEPLLEMDFENGILKETMDMRTDQFKIINDMWIYDFMPNFITINNNSVIIKYQYFENSSEFKKDIVNLAFNIFEDTTVDKIEFRAADNNNQSFTISRNEIFEQINIDNKQNNKSYKGTNSKSNDFKCPPTKEESYKLFVESYNKVIDAQQKGNNDAIKKAYDIYQKARDCYSKFKTEGENNGNYSEE